MQYILIIFVLFSKPLPHLQPPLKIIADKNSAVSSMLPKLSLHGTTQIHPT